jgi:hypothetical protein
MKYAIEMASYGIMCIPSFMKTGVHVQPILRFCLSNLKCYNVGITFGSDLRHMSIPLKWAQVE